jgi:hypothetical protein
MELQCQKSPESWLGLVVLRMGVVATMMSNLVTVAEELAGDYRRVVPGRARNVDGIVRVAAILMTNVTEMRSCIEGAACY